MIRRLRTAIARHLERRALANTAQMLGASPKLAWAIACDLIESPGDLRIAERLILDLARSVNLGHYDQETP